MLEDLSKKIVIRISKTNLIGNQIKVFKQLTYLIPESKEHFHDLISSLNFEVH